MPDTKGESNDRPLGTIEEVWREGVEWSGTARTLKTKDTRARNLASILALGGAAFGTLAVQFSPETPVGGLSLSSLFGVASAALIGLGTWIGRQTISPENERVWTRARSFAEALKRQVWLSLMQVPPYDSHDTAADALQKRVDELRNNTEVNGVAIRSEPSSSRALPEANGIDDYIRHRLEDQIHWYGKRATAFIRTVTFWKRLSSGLGLAATLLGLSAFSQYEVVAWVPVLTTAAAAVVSLLNADRYQALIPLYQDTGRQLRYRLARWHDLPASKKTQEEENHLIENCENIMASENQSWRAEWQSEPSTVQS